MKHKEQVVWNRDGDRSDFKVKIFRPQKPKIFSPYLGDEYLYSWGIYTAEADHFQYSMHFMMEHSLDFPKMTSWLNNNGGYCDCKVMEQIAPVWRRKFGDD